MCFVFRVRAKVNTAGLRLVEELQNVPSAVRIDSQVLHSQIKKIEDELEALPHLLNDLEHDVQSKGDDKDHSDRLVSVMREWRANEALNAMTSLRESVDEMEQRLKELAVIYAFDLEESGGIKPFLTVFSDLISEWKLAESKITRLEAQKKRDKMRRRKKVETERKLQKKLRRGNLNTKSVRLPVMAEMAPMINDELQLFNVTTPEI